MMHLLQRSNSCLRTFVLTLAALSCCNSSPVAAQGLPTDGERLAVGNPNTQLMRDGNRLLVHIDSEPDDLSITIPRVYASLVGIHFLNEQPHQDLTLHPEPDEWLIRWKPSVKFRNHLVLEFDSFPRLADETEPIDQAGDGTLTLPACQASTSGEKLRFEPQPHKNTVGYWTVPTDVATWNLTVDRPGEFNVGILQGCGKGQGGSEAVLTANAVGGSSASLDFTTVETGHFQNFIWRHLGTIHLEQAGDYELSIKPKRIAKAALMDVRMVQLSPAR